MTTTDPTPTLWLTVAANATIALVTGIGMPAVLALVYRNWQAARYLRASFILTAVWLAIVGGAFAADALNQALGIHIPRDLILVAVAVYTTLYCFLAAKNYRAINWLVSRRHLLRERRRRHTADNRRRIMQEMTHDAFFESQNGIITYANPRAYQMLGYDPESDELRGVAESELVHQSDLVPSLAYAALQRARYACRLLRKDGKVLRVEVLGETHILDGVPRRFSCVSDVTVLYGRIEEWTQLQLVDRAQAGVRSLALAVG